MNPAIVKVRVMQVAFIVSVLLFYFVLHVSHPAQQPVDPLIQLIVVSAAMITASLGLIVQRILLQQAPDQSLPLPQNRDPRSRWFSGHVIRFATAESVALVGFVLRMIGDSSNVVPVLFVVSLVLLTIWQPGEVPTETESQGPIR